MPYFKFQKSTAYDLFFLVFLSGIFYLVNLGGGSLASWDEAIYASVAKEMLRSGHWLRLTLEGSPWSDKPPLCIWATALFYKVFGINEFAARLFSALTGIGTIIVTYFFASKIFNRWIGSLAALVLLSSSHFIHFSRFGMMDAPITFFIALSLYFFWLGRERNRYLIFSGIALGLAIMTKSFSALFVLPVVWIYCLWARELDVLWRSSYWIGVILAVAIALPWNLYEIVAYRGLYMNDAVTKHLFLRTTKALDGHSGNLYYYIRTMVNKYHPWTLVSIFSAPLFFLQAIRTRRKEILFITVWMFLIFVVISLMQTKLDWYLLPVYPALSISVAYYLARIFKEEQKLLVQGMFVVVMVLHLQYSHIFNHDYSRELKGIAPATKSIIGPAEVIYFYDFHDSPAGNFYLEKKIAYLDDPNSFISQAKTSDAFYCFIYEKDLKAVNKYLSANSLSVKASFKALRLIIKEKPLQNS